MVDRIDNDDKKITRHFSRRCVYDWQSTNSMIDSIIARGFLGDLILEEFLFSLYSSISFRKTTLVTNF